MIKVKNDNKWSQVNKWVPCRKDVLHGSLDTNESFQAMNSNMPKATKLVETLITSYIPNDVIAN
jgi:hypothetical protein